MGNHHRTVVAVLSLAVVMGGLGCRQQANPDVTAKQVLNHFKRKEFEDAHRLLRSDIRLAASRYQVLLQCYPDDEQILMGAAGGMPIREKKATRS